VVSDDPGVRTRHTTTDDPGRREFLRSVAVRGALAALFGGVTLDTLAQRAVNTIEERRVLINVARRAAGRRAPLGVSDPHCHAAYSCGGQGSTVTCNDHSCGSVYGCTIRNLSCPMWFTCPTQYNCRPGVQHACPPVAFTCVLQFNPNYP